MACLGDSIARHICAGLMRTLGAPSSDFIFDKHGDFERLLDANLDATSNDDDDDDDDDDDTNDSDSLIRLTFHWHPFPENATQALSSWSRPTKPDVLITAVTLWHMLHLRSPEKFSTEVAALGAATTAFLQRGTGVGEMHVQTAHPVVLLSTASEVHGEKLVSGEKRAAMTSGAVDAYNAAIERAGALAPQGPFGMLDMLSLTYGKSIVFFCY